MIQMSTEFQLFAGLLLGIGLSAASGMRLFVPPLILSAANLYFHFPLPEQMGFLGTDTAFFVLLAATLFEIGAYYVPWIGNLLDAFATPLAMIAGTLLTMPFLGELDPVWRWSLAFIAGGTAAGTVQSLTTVTRLGSLATTGGVANPVIATVEMIASFMMSVFAIFFPVISAIFLLFTAFALYQIYRLSRRFMKKKPVSEAASDTASR